MSLDLKKMKVITNKASNALAPGDAGGTTFSSKTEKNTTPTED